MLYQGDYAEDATVYVMFNTFTSNDPSASSTITDFINTDVHIHKDDGLTQRNNAAGITVSVDFDSITGSHMIKIDTNDNTVAAFWVTGSDYFVRIEGTTVDGGAINAVVGHFSIENRIMRGTDSANTTTPPTVTEIQAEMEEDGASILDSISDLLPGSTIAAATDIPAMVGTDDAALATVVGVLADAAAAGDPTEADTLMKYMKQLINILIGTTGIGAFPAEAAPANAVSLAEVIRAIHADVTGLNGDVMVGTNSANTTTPPTVTEIQAEMEEDGASILDAISDLLPGSTIAAATDIPAMVGTNNAATAVKLLKYVQLLARSDAAIEGDLSTELGEINASAGSGVGNYSSQTDSGEAASDTLGHADYGLSKLVRATTPANKLDISSTGEAGLDFDNIKDASGAHTLTNITIPIAASVTVIGTDGITAASIKSDAVTEIQSGLATGTNVTDAHSTTDGKVDAIQTDLGDFSGRTNNKSLLAVLGVPDVSAKDLTTLLVTDRLDHATYGLSAIRTRGDIAWITGGGAGITDILNVQSLIPNDIDLANTATVRLALGLTNMIDDLPSTVEITPGTITIDRKAIGGTSWSNVVNAAAMSEAAGLIYYDEVFDTGTGYAEGDSLRITFKSQKITVSANDYEITDATGWIYQTSIRQTMVGTNGANTTVPDASGTAAGLHTATDSKVDANNTILGHASYGNAKLVRSTTPANTLDVDTDGEVDINMAQTTPGSPTSDTVGEALRKAHQQLPEGPQKNAAFNDLMFLMVDETDHATPETGLTVTGQVSKDAAAFGAVAGSIAEISNGIYAIDATAADMNADLLTFRFSATGADDTFITIKTTPAP